MPVMPDDIAVELGRPAPTTAQAGQWASWIAQARFLIGNRLGDIDTLDQDTVDYVVLQAVVAHVRNPENATQVDIHVDDAGTSKRYASSAGRVTILDEWWDMLTPDESLSSGAFTIGPFGAADRIGDGPMGWIR